MAWTKDEARDPPRVIYTPGDGDAAPGVVRLIYDPARTPPWIAEMTGVSAESQTQAEVEQVLGVS